MLHLSFSKFLNEFFLQYPTNKKASIREKVFLSIFKKLYASRLSEKKAEYFSAHLKSLKNTVLTDIDHFIFEIKDYYGKEDKNSYLIEFAQFLQEQNVISFFVVRENIQYKGKKNQRLLNSPFIVKRKIHLYLYKNNSKNSIINSNSYWNKALKLLSKQIENDQLQQKFLMDVLFSDPNKCSCFFENTLVKIIDYNDHLINFKKVIVTINATTEFLHYIPLVINSLKYFIQNITEKNFSFNLTPENLMLAQFFTINSLISHFFIKKQTQILSDKKKTVVNKKLILVPFNKDLKVFDSAGNPLLLEKLQKQLSIFGIIEKKNTGWKSHYNKYENIFKQLL